MVPAARPNPAGREAIAQAVGVIGLGEIGQVHVAAVGKSVVARLAAVADTAAELLQPFAAGGLPAYADAAGLIADPGVGTVCVCLHRDESAALRAALEQAHGENLELRRQLARLGQNPQPSTAK